MKEKMLQELVEGWGDRDNYPIDEHQINDYVQAGAILLDKRDNGDGTFCTTLSLCGKHLLCITTQ